MLERIPTDVMNIVETVFTSGEMGDWVTALMAAVIAIAAGILMSGYGRVVGTTIVALIVFVIARFIRVIIEGGEGVSVESTVDRFWSGFMELSMGTFLVYFIAFWVVISVVYAVRQAVSR